MSYMRGNHYLWSDGTRLHVWVSDGYDGWDESGWMDGQNSQTAGPTSDERPHPSGVGVEQAVVDEYVVMRFAELLRDGLLESSADRALSKHSGNGGCGALQNHAETIRRLANQR